MNIGHRREKRALDFFLRPRYCFLSVVKSLTITGAKRAVGCTKVCNFYHKKIFLSYFFIAQTGFSALYLLLVPFFPIFPFLYFALAASPVLSSCNPPTRSLLKCGDGTLAYRQTGRGFPGRAGIGGGTPCRPTEISAPPCSVPPRSLAAPPPISSR